MATAKCQAKDGPANCTNPRCPENHGITIPETPSPFLALGKLAQPKLEASWSNQDTVLFRTIHGSKLYGLAHPDSDDDYYVITPTAYSRRHLNAKHKIDGDEDTVTVDFATFSNMAQIGAPQALEAMFSRKSESPFFEAYRNNWFASDPQVIDCYIRTIHRFSMDDGPKQVKYHRHAIRLSMNLDEIVYTGRFNPTLSKSEVRTVKRLGELQGQQFLTELNAVNPFDLDWTHKNVS